MIKLLSALKSFRADENGAATIDFIVLTAAIVGIAFAVVQPIGNAIEEYANDSRRCMMILRNRVNRQDGTAASYNRNMRIAERNCGRVR